MGSLFNEPVPKMYFSRDALILRKGKGRNLGKMFYSRDLYYAN